MSKIEVNTVAPQCGTTLTLGESGDTVTLGAGASQSGFGRTGTVDWNTTPKTTGTFSAVSGDGFFLNTSGGVITANLPAGTPGAIVSFADYAGTWQTNKVTVVPNGSDKIGSQNENATLNTEGQSVTFVFVDSTQGWINTMDSTSNVRGSTFICASVSGACNTLTTVDTDFKLATFTGPGTFTVNSISNSAANNEVSYIVVAGGGSGMTKNNRSPAPDRYGQAGGGAGGFRERKSGVDTYTASPLNGATPITVTATGFPIAVGGGGAASAEPTSGTHGGCGVNSTFSSIVSTGGGAGAFSSVNDPTSQSGQPGGSGGAGSGQPGGAGGGVAGTGNAPPVSPAQGTPGGTGTSVNDTSGGAGGGATVAGGNAITTPSPRSNTGGAGGAGATTNISGSAVARAGGGGGGAGYTGCGGGTITGGAGGTGGGGTGGSNSPNNGAAGTAATGGGGGGAGGSNPGGVGGNGGGGIVMIRYKFQ